MIIKTEEKGGIKIYTVDKEYDDEKMHNLLSTFVKPSHIHKIIDHDADVFTVDGKLLIRFRKNKLPESDIDAFYDNIIKFAKHTSNNRGNSSGKKKDKDGVNVHVMSNIFGYFDRWSPAQKAVFKRRSFKPAIDVRECRFNMDWPELYEKTIPLIKDIDTLYKSLTPQQYALQRKKANETYFKIDGTSFTTVTTNVNYQTSIHCDKGDDEEGFGNLAVIERGKYTGGETCFPQYGIGVDVRMGDILFMDVHQPHANLPIIKKDKDTIRLSIVCYLRKNIWLKSKNKTRKFFERHRKTMKNLKAKLGKKK